MATVYALPSLNLASTSGAEWANRPFLTRVADYMIP
jgi:hypothetical protein